MTGKAVETTLSQESATFGTVTEEVGRVRASKHIDLDRVESRETRGVEHADFERLAPEDGDTGEVIELPDGSISIPVFEEQLIVTKQLVVRERVIVRKHTVYEEHQISADLRSERLELTTEGNVRIADA